LSLCDVDAQAELGHLKMSGSTKYLELEKYFPIGSKALII
jgi:hypothetical protein